MTPSSSSSLYYHPLNHQTKFLTAADYFASPGAAPLVDSPNGRFTTPYLATLTKAP